MSNNTRKENRLDAIKMKPNWVMNFSDMTPTGQLIAHQRDELLDVITCVKIMLEQARVRVEYWQLREYNHEWTGDKKEVVERVCHVNARAAQVTVDQYQGVIDLVFDSDSRDWLMKDWQEAEVGAYRSQAS